MQITNICNMHIEIEYDFSQLIVKNTSRYCNKKCLKYLNIKKVSSDFVCIKLQEEKIGCTYRI